MYGMQPRNVPHPLMRPPLPMPAKQVPQARSMMPPPRHFSPTRLQQPARVMGPQSIQPYPSHFPPQFYPSQQYRPYMASSLPAAPQSSTPFRQVAMRRALPQPRGVPTARTGRTPSISSRVSEPTPARTRSRSPERTLFSSHVIVAMNTLKSEELGGRQEVMMNEQHTRRQMRTFYEQLTDEFNRAKVLISLMQLETQSRTAFSREEARKRADITDEARCALIMGEVSPSRSHRSVVLSETPLPPPPPTPFSSFQATPITLKRRANPVSLSAQMPAQVVSKTEGTKRPLGDPWQESLNQQHRQITKEKLRNVEALEQSERASLEFEEHSKCDFIKNDVSLERDNAISSRLNRQKMLLDQTRTTYKPVSMPNRSPPLPPPPPPPTAPLSARRSRSESSSVVLQEASTNATQQRLAMLARLY